MITTITGIERDVTATRAVCQALIDMHNGKCCGRPATAISAVLPFDRTATACYCDDHGGTSRALEDLSYDWMCAAPDGVGAADQVIAAGIHGLDSRDANIVVRPEHGRWLAWLGIGGLMEPVLNPERTFARISRDGRPRTRGRNKRQRGMYAFATRGYAIAVARAAWRRHVDAHVDQIIRERGGTLAWGIPVAPRVVPLIVEPGEHGSAWDALRAQGGE